MMEHKRASRWYRWLWLSPFLTVPTLTLILFSDPGYQLICGGNYGGCDYSASFLVSAAIGTLGSGLWHLVLLAPAQDKRSGFIRAHGRQALLLAGLRTILPLAIVLFSGGDEGVMLWIFPVLIMVWLIGTSVGQTQAERGDCSLLRWLGDTETLEAVQQEIAEASKKDRADPEKLVHIIRFNKDPQARKRALQVLDKLGMVEHPEPAAAGPALAQAVRQSTTPTMGQEQAELSHNDPAPPAAADLIAAPQPANGPESAFGGTAPELLAAAPTTSTSGTMSRSTWMIIGAGVIGLGLLWIGISAYNGVFEASPGISTPRPTSTTSPEQATQEAIAAQANAHYQAGQDFYEQGDYEAAVLEYQLAIVSDENHASAMNNLAWTLAYELDRDYDEALSLAQRAVELEPDAAQLDTLALVYYKLGLFDDALIYYNQAIALDVNEMSFYLGRGDTYMALGQEPNALQDYLRFLSLTPDGPEREEVQERINSIQDTDT